VCENESNGGECFERSAAYCYKGVSRAADEPDQCSPTREECEERLKANVNATENELGRKPRTDDERMPKEPRAGTYCRELHGDEFSH
jgi:hypothetical protein